MATLLSLVDPYIRLANGTTVKSSSLSSTALKQYVINHPTVLRDGWIVSGGQIVQKPQPVPVQPAPAPPAPAPAAPAPLPYTPTGGGGGIGSVPIGTPPPTAAPMPLPGGGSLGVIPGGTPAPTGAPVTGTGGATGGTGPVNPVSTPVTPEPPKPVIPGAPTAGEFANYQDSTYWDELRQVNRQHDDAASPLAATLTRLTTRVDPTTGKLVQGGVGGATLYDLLYKQQQGNDARAVSLARSEAARKGVIRSGYMNRTASNLVAESVRANDGLVRQHGTDLTDQRSAAYTAAQEQRRLASQLEEAKAALAKSATARGHEQAMARYRATYGGY